MSVGAHVSSMSVRMLSMGTVCISTKGNSRVTGSGGSGLSTLSPALKRSGVMNPLASAPTADSRASNSASVSAFFGASKPINGM